MDDTANVRPWLFQKFRIPFRKPDTHCQARIRRGGVETYCDAGTKGERCVEHDVNKRKQAALNSVQQRVREGVTASLNRQDETLWEEPPVSPEEFFETFLREPLYPRQQEFVDALLGADPQRWDTTYHEGLALWGKGSGKDRTAAKVLAYTVYKLLCLRDPQAFLGLGRHDKIDLVNVGLNARQAKEVFFDCFKTLVENTINPKTGRNWFIEKGLNPQSDVRAATITFPKRIAAYSLNSEDSSAEGLNVLIAILDEVGEFETRKAKELHDSLRMTARSRFPKDMKLLLLSYKRSDGDYMMTRFREAEFEPTTFRSGPYATWDVNLKLRREDFTDEYTRDPETAQRVYECTGTAQESRFFAYRSRISQVIAVGNKENPVVGDRASVVELRNLQFKPWFKPQPTSGYFIHVDLGKGQRSPAGLAMGHFKHDMAVSLPDDYLYALAQDSGLSSEMLRQQHGQQVGGVVVDLALQVKAPPGGEILFDDVRVFVEQLRKAGWPIRMVTLDSWQSYTVIQGLRRAGINAQEQSVDKNTEAYGNLKSVIYRGLFECYPHPILVRELEELIVTAAGKVDHPELSFRRSAEEDGSNRGSKDVADAVAGCANLCLRYGKSNFRFGPAGLPDTSVLQPGTSPYRFESEGLVRYGEKGTRYRFPGR